MEALVSCIIWIAICVIAFLFGRYVFPKKRESDAVINLSNKVNTIITWADKWVDWADRFMDNASGEDKMVAVINKLQDIAKHINLDIDDESLEAIVQSAYEAREYCIESSQIQTAQPHEDNSYENKSWYDDSDEWDYDEYDEYDIGEDDNY